MAVSSPSAFPAYIFSHQTAGGKEADGWCDGTDNSVSFCVAMKEEGGRRKETPTAIHNLPAVP